ncbi:MAG: transposase [Planctomycetes bacterium]|nr:transposase [Planctomycetota bacterium]
MFDRFHVMRHVSKAVDDVRRREHKELWSRGAGRSRAPGTCGFGTPRTSPSGVGPTSMPCGGRT